MKARMMVAGWSVAVACLAAGALFAQSHPDAGHPGRRVGPPHDAGAPGHHTGHAGDAGAGPATHAEHDAGSTATTAAHDAGSGATSVAHDCSGVRCAAGTHCEMQTVMCVRAPCPPQPRCVPGAGH